MKYEVALLNNEEGVVSDVYLRYECQQIELYGQQIEIICCQQNNLLYGQQIELICCQQNNLLFGQQIEIIFC